MIRSFIAFCLLLGATIVRSQDKDIHIVFTSDLHFGLKKDHFRNSQDSVSSYDVNKAMAATIHNLGDIDYIIVTGDITNREEVPIQAASVSWKQFWSVYDGLHIPLLLVPGNHDLSNAIGHYREMSPTQDASSVVGIYNTMHPGHTLDTAHFQYRPRDFNYSRDIGGIHFMFISIWPDSSNRAWMEQDLAKIKPTVPVLIFAHDPPEADSKHFTNPDGGKLKGQEKYENLLPETYTSGYERPWDLFLAKHPNIKGYFHGHHNYQEFYTYKGLSGDLSLFCDRVDSPMKGKYSSKDEKLLSFQEIILHSDKKQLEIRECLWNGTEGKEVKWGESHILQL